MKSTYKKLFFVLSLLLTISCATQRFVEKVDKLSAADQLLQKNSEIKEPYKFTFRQREFAGFPNVYSPVIFPGANKQSDLPVKPGETFLELGSGTGIFSVTAALNGAKKVVAIDINPDAVANTRENARIHQVSNKLVALQGDMFGPLSETDRFDVIFFNIPFCHRNNANVKSMLDKSLFDPSHDLLYRFLQDGKKHLAAGGRMLLGYSTTHGDLPLMHQWAKENGWNVTLLNKDGDEKKDFITVELYEFRPRT